jgi:hypothetical protein
MVGGIAEALVMVGAGSTYSAAAVDIGREHTPPIGRLTHLGEQSHPRMLTEMRLGEVA